MEEYKKLLARYRAEWARVRFLERRLADRSEIHEADKKRDATHRQLRELAQGLGKSPQDVDIDILAQEGLKDYGLPEFQVINLKGNEHLQYGAGDYWDGSDVLHPISSSHMNIRDVPETVFIPFGEEFSWRLGNYCAYFQRQPDNLERRRRAAQVEQGFLDQKVKLLEVVTMNSFHRGIKIFGVACKIEDFDLLISYLKTHRQEITIDQETFDKNTLENDFIEIVEDDLQGLSGESQEASIILEDYENLLMNIKSIESSLKEKLRLKVREAEQKVHDEQQRDQVNREVEENLQKSDDKYEPYTSLFDSRG